MIECPSKVSPGESFTVKASDMQQNLKSVDLQVSGAATGYGTGTTEASCSATVDKNSNFGEILVVATFHTAVNTTYTNRRTIQVSKS